MTRKRNIALASFATMMILGSGSVYPVLAASEENKSTDVCANLSSAWESRQAGYERAKTVRTEAFSKTYSRWTSLFDKLDLKGISTETVRSDAKDVSLAFNNLMAADDAVMAAMKKYAEAVCSKTGVSEAKTSHKESLTNRRNMRKEYNKAMKTLHLDLSGLKASNNK